jgi:hypothetical protein
MATGLIGAPVVRAQRDIVDYFTMAGATTPEYAIAFAEPRRRIARRVFRRMVDFGAVVLATDGKYWLDERRLADFRKENLAKVLGTLAIAGLAAAGAIALNG